MDYYSCVAKRTRAKKDLHFLQLYHEFKKKRGETSRSKHPSGGNSISSSGIDDSYSNFKNEVEEIKGNGNKEAVNDTQMESESKRRQHEAASADDDVVVVVEESDPTGMTDNDDDDSEDIEVEEIDKFDFENKKADCVGRTESRSKVGSNEGDDVVDSDKFEVEESDPSGTNDNADDSEETEVEEIDKLEFEKKMADDEGFNEGNDAPDIRNVAFEASKQVPFLDSDDSLSSSESNNDESDDMDYEMEHSDFSDSVESSSSEGINDDSDHSEEIEFEEIEGVNFVNKKEICAHKAKSKSKDVFREADVAANAKKPPRENMFSVDLGESLSLSDPSNHDSVDPNFGMEKSDFSAGVKDLRSFEEEINDDNDHSKEIDAEKSEGVNFVNKKEICAHKAKSKSKYVFRDGDVAASAKKPSCKVSKHMFSVDLDESLSSSHPSNHDSVDPNFGMETPDFVVGVKGLRSFEEDEDDRKDEETRKPAKRRRVGESEDDDTFKVPIDSILEKGVIESEADEHKAKMSSESVGDELPLKFRFEDESSTTAEKSEFDKMVDDLFSQLEFAKTCEEMGSLDPPVIENENANAPENESNQFTLCRRGIHQLLIDEEIGKRCIYCPCVVLEIKYVTAPFKKHTTGVSERENFSGQNDNSILDDLQFKSSGNYSRNMCNHSKGTVWDIIPGIRDSMYPHQQDGFEFLWKNLAGTINLHELKNSSSSGVGGCIISHAPGTGKTRLTMVFIEAYLKLFPNCFPAIIAPASMLLTWEEEFRKWKIKFPFHNLNNPELTGKEKVALNFLQGNKRMHRDSVRLLKMYSWRKGKSILGVSYNLYEMLAGEKFIGGKGKGKGKGSKKGEKAVLDKKLQEWRKILLELPGLVVLDEGHTPRNERSCIWNTLSKLQTEKRIILSGTPFQNNFNELFNTLCLVRPATAVLLAKQKPFSDSKRKYFRRRKFRDTGASVSSTSGKISDNAIEKLKETIAPFVHVHKGSILQESLPGLRDSIVLLNPPQLQKDLIGRIEGSQNTFEFEHKVALLCTHPSLLQHCSLSDKEKSVINEDELEKLKLNPENGVKTRFIMELIRLSVAMKEKVLIFSQYIPPLELMKDLLKAVFDWDEGKEVLQMQGNMEQKHRQNLIDVFNDPNSEAKILLGSTKCCSEGINLVGASRVVLLDVVWNPSVQRQAISRAYRLGQKKVVYTYNLIASGTTEWNKYCRQAEKYRLSELVFSSSSNENDMQKNLAAGFNDKILEEMVGHTKMKDMFEKIIYQPKETYFIENFGLASLP